MSVLSLILLKIFFFYLNCLVQAISKVLRSGAFLFRYCYRFNFFIHYLRVPIFNSVLAGSMSKNSHSASRLFNIIVLLYFYLFSVCLYMWMIHGCAASTWMYRAHTCLFYDLWLTAILGISLTQSSVSLLGRTPHDSAIQGWDYLLLWIVWESLPLSISERDKTFWSGRFSKFVSILRIFMSVCCMTAKGNLRAAYVCALPRMDHT